MKSDGLIAEGEDPPNGNSCRAGAMAGASRLWSTSRHQDAFNGAVQMQSTFANATPGVGVILGAHDAIQGEDSITHEPMSPLQRGLAFLGIGGAIAGALKGMNLAGKVAKAADKVADCAPIKEAKDILVLGRGTPEKLADVAEAVGGRVINNPAASGNPRALWKHIYGEMRKADEIVQVLDDIPTKQVGGRGSGEWARAEKIFIDSMEALRKKRTTIYRKDLGLE